MPPKFKRSSRASTTPAGLTTHTRGAPAGVLKALLAPREKAARLRHMIELVLGYLRK